MSFREDSKVACRGAHRPTVVVTGICGNLGRRVARVLHRRFSVVGLDRRPFEPRPKDIEHHTLDLRQNRVEDIFRQRPVHALVHLGVVHDPRSEGEDSREANVEGLSRLLEYARRHQVRKVLLLSSGNVYGPRPANAQFLTEDAPLLASGSFSGTRDIVALDLLVQSFMWKHPNIDTVILRPANILGTVRNAPSNYLRLQVAPTLLGFDPMIQMVHQQDVVSAVELALAPAVRGIFNAAGPPPICLSRVLARLNRKTLPVPYHLARFGLDKLWKLRMSSFPAPELDFVRYVCMVDDSRARKTLGYRPRFDMDATLQAVDAERWVAKS